jgi:nitrite reductase/ring-hydroxylating ferredoxin subunit
MSGRRHLCRLDELPDPGSRGFTLGSHTGAVEIFMVRRGPQVYAYRNSCPHTGATLEWQPDVFLDHSRTLIQCGLHGALFRIENGECVHGPCVGRHLEAVPVEVRDGTILLRADPIAG